MKTVIVRLVVIYVGLIFINLIFAAQSDALIDPKTAMGIWLLRGCLKRFDKRVVLG
jgi:hypothetical protein